MSAVSKPRLCHRRSANFRSNLKAAASSSQVFHSGIGFDHGSGTILRLVLEADPDLGSSMERADIMVEYGPVTTGGQAHTRPIRSVAYSMGAVFPGISANFAATQANWTLEAAPLLAHISGLEEGFASSERRHILSFHNGLESPRLRARVLIDLHAGV